MNSCSFFSGVLFVDIYEASKCYELPPPKFTSVYLVQVGCPRLVAATRNMPGNTQSYVTSPDSHIRITNHPTSASGVTPIQIVTLNRPDKLNAITIDMINALAGFFGIIDADDRVKAIVLTGAGRVFSAGTDLNADTSQLKEQPAAAIRDPGGTLALAMYNCSKPIIVAFNGLSVGIGMTSTLAATIR